MDEQKYKIIHEKEICIGCWACANVTPEHWEMHDDENGMAKSHVKGSETVDGKEVLEITVDFDKNKEAAEVCPVNCIHLEKEGKRII